MTIADAGTSPPPTPEPGPDAPATSPAAARSFGRVAMLVNPRSGTAPAFRDVLDRLTELAGEGLAGDATPQDPFERQLAALHQAKPDTIIAVGGDGTINAAAQAALKADAALAIVPAGTMNLVARDLGIEGDPDTIVGALPTYTERPVDVASVNGHLFLHSSLIGVVSSMARYREHAREGGLLARLGYAMAMIRHAFRSPPLGLTLDADGNARSINSRCVVVTNNPLAEDRPLSHRRLSLDAGTMGVYVSLHEGPFAVGRLLAGLATGRLSTDPEVTAAVCATLRIRTRRRTLLASNDGEVIRLQTPLEYRLHPRALRVLAPGNTP